MKIRQQLSVPNHGLPFGIGQFLLLMLSNITAINFAALVSPSTNSYCTIYLQD